MKRDLKLNMSHLDAISRKVQSYIDAMEAVGLAARKFEQTIKDQDSDAYNKLSEQWETNVWENETAMMRVDRNDIWWNYKQIEVDIHYLKEFHKNSLVMLRNYLEIGLEI